MMELELELLRQFVQRHPVEAAQELEKISDEEVAAVLADQPADEAALVLGNLAPLTAAEALGAMGPESAAPLLCRVDPELATALLRAQPIRVRETLLTAIPQPWQAPIARALRVAPGTVCDAMDPRPLTLVEDHSAEEALAQLRRRGGDSAVFIVDRSGSLVGTTSASQLLAAEPHRLAASVMTPAPDRLAPATLLRGLEQEPMWEEADVLPVVLESGRLIGSLSHLALRVRARRQPSIPLTERAPTIWLAAEMALSGYTMAVEAASALIASGLRNGDET